MQHYHMKELLSRISIEVNEKIYLKDPASSELGQKIISGSIELISGIGFEHFTFRKLADHINSTEASIYRYFENKHKILLYLTSWYWGWMEYRLVFHTANIDCPVMRLRKAVDILSREVKEDSTFTHIDEAKLHKIIVSESPKAYLTKNVDTENEDGVFSAYKSLVKRASKIILEVRKDYKYPHMLISTIIEGAHHQRFFSEHLPSLTDCVEGEDAISRFCCDMVLKTLNSKYPGT